MIGDALVRLQGLVAGADVVVDRPPHIVLSIETMREIKRRIDQMAFERRLDQPPFFIGEEAAMLAKACMNALLYRADGADELAMRWTMIAGALRPWVRTDLANAIAANRQEG